MAVGSVVLVQVCTQLTFLSYGTTARAARLYGSGQRAAAVAAAMAGAGSSGHCTSVALCPISNGILALLCPVLVHGGGPVAGIGLPGSAVANVVAQVLAAGLFLRALVAERAVAAPCWPAMRAQLKLGRDLVLRAVAFQSCFLSSALLGFLPAVWAGVFRVRLGFDRHLVRLAAFMVLRLGFVLVRTCGAGWAVTGAVRLS